MLRSSLVLAFAFTAANAVTGQSIPRHLLSAPNHLELDKPSAEAKAGSRITYKIILKNAQDQPVAASSNMQLDVQTPSGPRVVTLPAGQSSVDFAWDASTPGISKIEVRSGNLHPASGWVLVPPPPRIAPGAIPPPPQPPPNIADKKSSNHKATDYKVWHGPLPNVIAGGATSHPGSTIGATAAGAGAAGGSGGASAGTASPSSSPVDTNGGAAAHANKIQLYVAPLPIYGDASKHMWKASVSIAAVADQGLAPVASDLPVHLSANAGSFSSPDVVIPAGQISNFDHPVVLTASRSGSDTVKAISSLGPAEDVPVNYLQPPPKYLRLSVGTPVLSGSGSSTASVQVCVLDESQVITSADQEITVNLSAPGTLTPQSATIKKDNSCSSTVTWISEAGLATINAESAGLVRDRADIRFLAFPWKYPWLAALGGLIGALLVRWKGVFSAAWWSHAWRSLLLGAGLGVIFYLFMRFNALVLPENWMIKLQNLPVVSSPGSFLIGFAGGLLGRKFWVPKKDKAEGATGGAQGASGGH